MTNTGHGTLPRRCHVILLLLGIIGMTGCSQTVARFGVATDPGVVPSRSDAIVGDSAKVEGKSCRVGLLVIPLSTDRIDRALADAERKSGGLPLYHITVRQTSWFTILVNKVCFVVEGYTRTPVS